MLTGGLCLIRTPPFTCVFGQRATQVTLNFPHLRYLALEPVPTGLKCTQRYCFDSKGTD